MSERLSPPFRAEHIGSFMRPLALLEARGDFDTGKIGLAEAKTLEKNAYKVPLAQTLVRRALAKAAGV